MTVMKKIANKTRNGDCHFKQSKPFILSLNLEAVKYIGGLDVEKREDFLLLRPVVVTGRAFRSVNVFLLITSA